MTKSKGKSKGGRPRKDRTGIPNVSPLNAIRYTKKAYKILGETLTSFGRMAESMGMKPDFAKVGLGIISNNYGLIQQEGSGWKITDLGRRVSEDDKNAIIEVMIKVPILAELYNVMKDKMVDRDYIEDYITRKRARLKASFIAEKYLETINYINSLLPTDEELGFIPPISTEWFNIVQLDYALTPLKKEEISNLAEEVANELEKHQDPAIKVLARQMKQNLDNPENLKLLVHSIKSVLSVKYPSLIIETKNKKIKEEKPSKTEESEENS